MRLRWHIFVIPILLALIASSFAQVTTTTMVGTVTDPSGAVVPGAKIIVTNIGTNRTQETVSNERGAFRVDLLPAGSYSVAVTATGFKKLVRNGITLNAGVSATIDTTLEPGDVTQKVEVTADVPLVNTVNPEIGQTIESTQIQELPLVNRNAYALLDLTPGVQSNQGSAQTPNIVFGAPQQITYINGGMDQGMGSVNYYLDGGPNMSTIRNSGNLLPNPDALQEFRVQTNSYSAQYGRFANGVINTVIKSGTNAFHGSAFEFLRNDKLNAKTWGATAKPPLHRNQFGFTFGGPVIKDKTFFFGSYAGLRQNMSSDLRGAVVPTALERAGDFRQSAVIPIDPTTTKTFQCNGVVGVMCANRMDPVAVKLLNEFVPLPNAANNGWQGSITSPYNTDEYLAKVDHTLNNSHKLSAMFFTSSGKNAVNSGGNLPYSMTNYTWRQTNANVSDTWVISPTLVNQTWLSFSRMLGSRLSSPNKTLADYGSTQTVQGTPTLPNIAVSGYFTLGQQISAPGNSSNYYAVRDLVVWNKGHHTLSFGGDLALDKAAQPTNLGNYGSFTFSATMTGNSSAKPTKLPANAFADFLLGIPTSLSQDAPAGDVQVSWDTALFVQDDWRVNQRLTLNMGLRWDVQTPPVYPGMENETAYVPGRQSTVKPQAPLGQLFPGDKGITRGIIPVRWGHFSPRFGFAYDPTGSGKTSVRGAFGVFWGSISSTSWNNGASNEPFSIRYSFTNGSSLTGATLSDPYRGLTGGNPFPYLGNTWVNAGAISPTPLNFDWPYTYQLNFSVTRQVTNSLSVMAAYVGSLSHDLPYAVDVNYPQAACPQSLATQCGSAKNPSVLPTKNNYQLRRPDQNYGAIKMGFSNQNAFYHGLQLSATKRMSNHVSLSTFYTYSKTLQNVSLGGSGVGSGAAQDYNNLAAERSRASTDLRHMFTAAIVWQPDYFHGQNRLLKAALVGWEVSPIIKLRSGSPFTVNNASVDANLDGQTNDRAQLVGDPHIDHPSATQWFNTAAFAQNVAGTTIVNGNSSLNMLEGPGSKNVDLALSRAFHIHEGMKLQFRAEATNAFNIVNLNNPNASVGSKAFGTITSAKDMRQMQMGLRLTF